MISSRMLTFAVYSSCRIKITSPFRTLQPFLKLGNIDTCNGLSNNVSTTALQNQSKREFKVTFIKSNGDRITSNGKEGDSLLDVVVNNNLDFDGFGACEGTLTCSTCHCIFKKEDFDRLPEKPSDEEMDMLDLAYDLTDTSRLGCQIQLTEELDNLEVKIPATINDARS